jgi:peptidoglycan hydrolase-like protein with peptidoglycan-binding domain
VKRRELVLILILCMCFTVLLPQNVFAASTLRYGDQGSGVRTLQEQLNQLGYNCGTPDGVFGQRTRDAVKALQRDHGLTADGIVGSRTRSVINSLVSGGSSGSNSSLLKYGSRGTAVKQLQQDLTALGYDCGTPDGVFGNRTVSAVKAFQRACNLTADGIAGSRTLSKIEELIENGADRGNVPITPTVMKYGSRGNAVRALQEKLNALGYHCGTPDGIFGSGTVSAVKAFQRYHGLTADGIAGPQTQLKINDAQPQGSGDSDTGNYTLLKKGDTGSAVKTLQQRLNALDYDCGTPDGIFGGGTEEAVRQFQGVNGLVIDGVAGPVTQQKLYGGSAKANDGNAYTGAINFTLTRTLKKGSIGTDVKKVQRRLNELGFDCGTPDGVYGSGTMRAAIGYQITRGLCPDGCVGPDTANKMFARNGGTKVMDLPAYDLDDDYDAIPDFTRWTPDAGKVNLVWHGNMDYEISSDAIDVVAPVWFTVCIRDGKTRVNTDYIPGYVGGAHNAGYKVWVTVQSFTPGYTKLIVNNEGCQDQVIADLTSAVDNLGLDGINFDFENMDPADQKLYTAFIARAAAALHAHGAMVSVDINKKKDTNNWWTSCYDRAGLGQVADYLCLMTYDQYTDSPGPCASIGWVEQAVQATLTEVPAEKLLMGIPLYGYDWINNSRKTLTLEDFSDLANYGRITLLSGEVWQVSRWITTPRWSGSTGTNYMKFKDQHGKIHEAWYESDESIELKLDLINEYGLAGACSWRYGYAVGKEMIWDSFQEKLNP